MKYTNNLGLCLVEPADKFSTEPFAENAEKLDAAVASLSHPNLLNNWYLADPVNQRGQTEYGGTAWVYTVDRWKTSAAYTTVTVGRGVTITTTKENTVPYLLQPIQNQSELLGKTVTLSVMLGDGQVEYAAAALPTANPSGMKTYATIANVGQIIYMNGYWFVRLCAPKGGTNTFLAVKLEVGSTQTLAHRNTDGVWVLNDRHPDKGMEQLRCCMSTADSADTFAGNRKTAAVVGAARVETGAYTGTGGCDGVLNFGFAPRFVYIAAVDGGVFWIAGQSSVPVGGAAVTFEQNGDSLSWHSEQAGLLNGSGETYRYFAIG